MNARSLATLAKVNPRFSTIIQSAAAQLAKDGVEILVVSGTRTAAEQNADFAIGRTIPGKIVTNARAGQSMHCYGLAADIVPIRNATGTALNWDPKTPQFQHMVQVLKAAGLEWGGDWKGSLGDFDHFQMGQLPSSPSIPMMTDYANSKGALLPIWAKADRGLYALYAPPATAQA